MMSSRERRGLLFAVPAPVLLAFLWQAIAGFVTGRPDAALATLSAWPTYAETGGSLGGWSRVILGLEPLGVLAILGILTLVLIVIRKEAAGWGTELRAWVIIYPLYLLAATKPSSSILRYLMLGIVPFWPLPNLARKEMGRIQILGRWLLLIGLVSLGLVMQYKWVMSTFIISDDFSHHRLFP